MHLAYCIFVYSGLGQACCLWMTPCIIGSVAHVQYRVSRNKTFWGSWKVLKYFLSKRVGTLLELYIIDHYQHVNFHTFMLGHSWRFSRMWIINHSLHYTPSSVVESCNFLWTQHIRTDPHVCSEAYEDSWSTVFTGLMPGRLFPIVGGVISPYTSHSLSPFHPSLPPPLPPLTAV